MISPHKFLKSGKKKKNKGKRKARKAARAAGSTSSAHGGNAKRAIDRGMKYRK